MPHRCDECRYWDADDREQRRAGDMKVRRCAKALQWWDATERTDEVDPENDWYNQRRLAPKAVGTKMFVQDGSEYRADLLTAGDFFCAHFEPLKEGVVPFSEIVKVQVSPKRSSREDMLVYDQEHRRKIMMLLPTHVAKQLGDDLKGYFNGRWSRIAGWIIGERVPDQDW